MNNETIASFVAAIAYGWLALLGLLAAALVVGEPVAVRCALLACAAAYVSQTLLTQAAAKSSLQTYWFGCGFQLLSWGLWLAGLIAAV